LPVDLPDVNALIALFDRAHVHHGPAHAWFTHAAKTGWATTAITENGLVRIVSNPRYTNGPISALDAAEFLRQMKGNHADTHRFLASDVSITDESLFDLSAIHGHQQLTDLYLLGLCHRHGARLVTFDSAIAALLRNVHGGTPETLCVLTA
jgi:toxin-antitoxin system PIN domain toxin